METVPLELRLRLMREAIAGPLGARERDELREQYRELVDDAAAALRDPSLRHDYATLRSCQNAGGMIAFEQALATRRALRADTSAPRWLRQLADDVVEGLRFEVLS